MSAALAVGNNTFSESLALLTAGTEVTRQANKVSRGLISVQSRLNQIVDESSDTGKALTEWYREHNIAIYDQEGQIRSLYDVLKDVADIWPTLTKNEQAYYLNQQAGRIKVCAPLAWIDGKESELIEKLYLYMFYMDA